MNLDNYRRKESWSKNGQNFLIEIVKWYLHEDQNPIWNYYCYIYSKHKLFNELKEDICNSGYELKLHHGCTYVQWHRNEEGQPLTKTYGCDYQHIWDDNFNDFSEDMQKNIVFKDAEELFEQLQD